MSSAGGAQIDPRDDSRVPYPFALVLERVGPSALRGAGTDGRGSGDGIRPRKGA